MNYNELITYDVTESQLEQIRNKYMSLSVATPEDRENYKLVKCARLEIKSLRCSVEKRRKELKADSLKFGQLVDSKAKAITVALFEIENHLQVQQDIVDKEEERQRLEKERLEQEKINLRVFLLGQYGHLYPNLETLKNMSDDEFDQFLYKAKQEYDQKQMAQEEERRRREVLEQETLRQQEELRQQQMEMQKLKDELLAKQREELRKAQEIEAEHRRQLEEAAKEKRRVEAEAQKAKLEEEKKAQEKIANEQLFLEIKTNFPTLESCWVEIARLRALCR